MISHKITFKKPNDWDTLPLYKKIKYYSSTLDQQYSIYVDKLEAKKIVSEMTNGQIKIAKVVKELTDINDIKQNDINQNHLLKTTHASKWNLDFKEINDIKDVRIFLKEHNKIFSTEEKQYLYIKPRFFIEEKINDLYTGISGKAFVFMFRCIHGKPVSIGIKFEIKQNYLGIIKTNTINLLYDTEWNYIPQKNIDSRFRHIRINKPINLDIMIKNAEILSNRFEFVRIDYYIDKNNDIYFSEFTFTPSAGKITFDPVIEMKMGQAWI
jgi:hypothetical protein